MFVWMFKKFFFWKNNFNIAQTQWSPNTERWTPNKQFRPNNYVCDLHGHFYYGNDFIWDKRKYFENSTMRKSWISYQTSWSQLLFAWYEVVLSHFLALPFGHIPLEKFIYILVLMILKSKHGIYNCDNCISILHGYLM